MASKDLHSHNHLHQLFCHKCLAPMHSISHWLQSGHEVEKWHHESLGVILEFFILCISCQSPQMSSGVHSFDMLIQCRCYRLLPAVMAVLQISASDVFVQDALEYQHCSKVIPIKWAQGYAMCAAKCHWHWGKCLDSVQLPTHFCGLW